MSFPKIARSHSRLKWEGGWAHPGVSVFRGCSGCITDRAEMGIADLIQDESFGPYLILRSGQATDLLPCNMQTSTQPTIGVISNAVNARNLAEGDSTFRK